MQRQLSVVTLIAFALTTWPVVGLGEPVAFAERDSGAPGCEGSLIGAQNAGTAAGGADVPSNASDAKPTGGTIAASAFTSDNQTTGLKQVGNDGDIGSSLSDAQRLTIRFEKYEKLSGDYRISAENTIAIPGLGLINVGSISSSELKNKLSELVVKLGGREADISVEIADYRPIFVTGLVRNSGSYPWKPGMIVLHAETLSGGIGSSGGKAGGESILATNNEVTRQQKAEADLKRVLASLSRLKAEKIGSAIIDVSERLAEIAGPQESAELIRAQSLVMQTRKASFDGQFASLEQGARLVRKELEGLKAQLVRIQANTVARRAVLKQIDELLQKKLVRTERKLEEESKVSELEEREANVTVGIVRSEGVLLALQRDFDNLKRERQSSIDTEIFRLEREAAQLEIDIAGASLAQKTLAQVDLTRVGGEGGSALHYEIFRTTGDQAETLPADRLSRLKPGDVLVVSVSDEQRSIGNMPSGKRTTTSALNPNAPGAHNGF